MLTIPTSRVSGPITPKPFVFTDWLDRECAGRPRPARAAPRRFHFARVRTHEIERRTTWLIDAKDVATCLVTDDPLDERGCLRHLALLLDLYARTHGDTITAVCDGEPFDLVPTRDLRVDLRFAGRSTRYELLARLLASCRRPSDAYVATSNQAFAMSVRHRGAQVIPPRVFRGWLESLR
jgi:hypothetical protein